MKQTPMWDLILTYSTKNYKKSCIIAAKYQDKEFVVKSILCLPSNLQKLAVVLLDTQLIHVFYETCQARSHMYL